MSENVKLVPLRMSESLAEQIREAARAEGTSINAWATRILSQTISQNRAPEAPVARQFVETGDGDVYLTPPVEVPPLGGWRWAWEREAEDALRVTHVLLIGGYGLGKSVFAARSARTAGRPVYMVSCSYGVERDTLEGAYRPRPGESGVNLIAVDGIVTSALATGGYLLIEEISRLPGDLVGRLLAALNTHRGTFDVSYRGGSVTVHPEFRCIATANPPTRDYRTDRLDSALLSRFAVVEVSFPKIDELLGFLGHIGLPVEYRESLANFARDVHKKYTSGELDHYVSPREMVQFARLLAAGVPERRAFELAISSKFGIGAPKAAQVRAGLWESYRMRRQGISDGVSQVPLDDARV